ncbi:MAG: endonuclease [Rhodobacterales bacterium CG2_30_65_12]|nr:MAG: endonuclease [Rhodobacterales bacterium CG2_30_65_12]
MGRLTALCLALSLAAASTTRAETIRFATYAAELDRRGPGLLLADILKGEEQVQAVIAVIAEARPDVLLLTGFDHDREGHALAAFAQALGAVGVDYPHRFAAPPNTGVETGRDMDGNGKLGEARDAQGYGAFTGAGGMAVLSRYPLGEVRDFSTFLWADLPGAIAPVVDDRPFPSPEAHAAQRLSSVAHWEVPVALPGGTVRLLAFNATTPVYDGPEDLNGRRNHDEIVFWRRLLDGDLPFDRPEGPVVVIGNANLDPADGEGRREAISALIADPRLADPRPASDGARGVANPGHAGDPALDTVDWSDPRPGNLRVDYVLPDARLTVVSAGVLWPAPSDPFAETVNAASRHRLVWVDIVLP